MKRLLAALALAAALGACSFFGGPTQAQLQQAVDDYYATQSQVGAETDLADLEDATINDFEGCVPANGIFRCVVAFTTPDGNVMATLWTSRGAQGGWRIQNIVINEAAE